MGLQTLNDHMRALYAMHESFVAQETFLCHGPSYRAFNKDNKFQLKNMFQHQHELVYFQKTYRVY